MNRKSRKTEIEKRGKGKRKERETTEKRNR